MTTAFFLDLRSGRGGPLIPSDNEEDDRRTGEQRAGADQQQRVGTERLDQRRGQRRAGHAPECNAATDEAKQPLGLTRIVDAIGQRPELADEQHTQQQAPNVKRDRYPVAATLEQHPEGEHDAGHPDLRDRQGPPSGQRADDARVGQHQQPDEQSRAENDPRHVDGAEAGDQVRPCQRLDDVVGRHRQERIGEHQEDADRFLLPHLDESTQDARQQGHSRKSMRQGT
jgi:hypothetical protein